MIELTKALELFCERHRYCLQKNYTTKSMKGKTCVAIISRDAPIFIIWNLMNELKACGLKAEAEELLWSGKERRTKTKTILYFPNLHVPK